MIKFLVTFHRSSYFENNEDVLLYEVTALITLIFTYVSIFYYHLSQ